jgi:hypothetical protein
MAVRYRLEAGAAAPGIDLLDRLARALGTTAADLLAEPAPDPTPVLRDQARRLFDTFMAAADRDDLVALTPVLARFRRGA